MRLMQQHKYSDIIHGCV